MPLLCGTFKDLTETVLNSLVNLRLLSKCKLFGNEHLAAASLEQASCPTVTQQSAAHHMFRTLPVGFTKGKVVCECSVMIGSPCVQLKRLNHILFVTVLLNKSSEEVTTVL